MDRGRKADLTGSIRFSLPTNGTPEPVLPAAFAQRKARWRSLSRMTAGTLRPIFSCYFLELLKRKGGVTAKELMTATGWQPHSVRGFISGTVSKKMGLTVESAKGADGERTYSIRG
jgi:Protein of unknown function (DUF3489)